MIRVFGCYNKLYLYIAGKAQFSLMSFVVANCGNVRAYHSVIFISTYLFLLPPTLIAPQAVARGSVEQLKGSVEVNAERGYLR